MKRIPLLCAASVVSIFIPSITGAQAATECHVEIVKGRTAHWSWRLIDGRKCWYEGKHKPNKSELYWADKKAPASAVENALEPRATDALTTNAQASPPPAAEDFTDPEDGSCCWPSKDSTKSSTRNEYQSEPPRDEETFEARWRSLGLRPRN
jgi:hypothetical protein